jgi:hypothetical protein
VDFPQNGATASYTDRVHQRISSSSESACPKFGRETPNALFYWDHDRHLYFLKSPLSFDKFAYSTGVRAKSPE